MQYYGTRLSENISRREPEGYLLCLNVPVARTGYQEYLPEELGLNSSSLPSISLPSASGAPPLSCQTSSSGPLPLIKVYRPEEEVFSPETMASFEGMPVTNDHPPDGVDAENIRRLQRGHAHNIRRGAGSESDLLLADLIITDPLLIDAILAGKREISCGYTYELSEENGRYVQRRIRGNHIAVVDVGRAGPRVCIRDAAQLCLGCSAGNSAKSCPPASLKTISPPARSEGSSLVSNKPNPKGVPNPMKKSLTKALARLAKDGDIETVAEFIEEMIPEAAETAPADDPVTVEVPESREITIDEESIAALVQRLDQLITLMTGLLANAEPAADEDPVAEEVAEAIEEVLEAAEPAAELPSGEIAGLVEEILDPEASVTLEESSEDECGEPDPAAAKDAMRAVLMTFRPVLQRMSSRDRRKACADIAARFSRTRKAGDGRVYAALASASRGPAPNLSALGKRIMASRNANYKK